MQKMYAVLVQQPYEGCEEGAEILRSGATGKGSFTAS